RRARSCTAPRRAPPPARRCRASAPPRRRIRRGSRRAARCGAAARTLAAGAACRRRSRSDRRSSDAPTRGCPPCGGGVRGAVDGAPDRHRIAAEPEGFVARIADRPAAARHLTRRLDRFRRRWTCAHGAFSLCSLCDPVIVAWFVLDAGAPSIRPRHGPAWWLAVIAAGAIDAAGRARRLRGYFRCLSI